MFASSPDLFHLEMVFFARLGIILFGFIFYTTFFVNLGMTLISGLIARKINDRNFGLADTSVICKDRIVVKMRSTSKDYLKEVMKGNLK